MRIKLLIATSDDDYAEKLSAVLADRHADVLDVSVCSTAARLRDVAGENYEAVLMEPAFAAAIPLEAVRLPLLLWDDSKLGVDVPEELKIVAKYQRISKIAGDILRYCAELDVNPRRPESGKAHITAVWSPAGGVGKTSVALAYATRKAMDGKSAVYLCLENFSSVPACFPADGKGLSTVFEKLGADVEMLFKGVRRQDSGTGIAYFNGPDNYDDINVLSEKDVETLLSACATGADELVVDLSSVCDKRTRKILELADAVFLVFDQSKTSREKLRQFMTQHDVYAMIEEKVVPVANKGAKAIDAPIANPIELPHARAGEFTSVYKNLSNSNFER